MNITELINMLNYEEPNRYIRKELKQQNAEIFVYLENNPHSKRYNNQINQILKQYHFLKYFTKKNKWRELLKC